jgi:hypothetical protein
MCVSTIHVTYNKHQLFPYTLSTGWPLQRKRAVFCFFVTSVSRGKKNTNYILKKMEVKFFIDGKLIFLYMFQ